MVRNLAALGADVIEVPLWWRKISEQEYAVVVQARRMGSLHAVVRPGMASEIRSFLEAERRLASAGMTRSMPDQQRLQVLDGFNAKLDRILMKVDPGQDFFVPTPMRLHDTGAGLTFWVEGGGLAVGELLELRFSLFADFPMPVHGYCRVQRLRREWSGWGVRVDCLLATLDDSAPASPAGATDSREPAPEPAPKPAPIIPERAPIPTQEWPPIHKPAPKPTTATKPVSPAPDAPSIEETFPPEPSLWDSDPQETSPVKLDPEPSIWESESDETSSVNNKAELTLVLGNKILKRDLKHTAVTLEDRVPHDLRDPNLQRKDFRLNDYVQFQWKIISKQTFDHAVQVFKTKWVFPTRKSVLRQNGLMADIDQHIKTLRMMTLKARRPVVLLRDRLDFWFRQASSENEEEYFQQIAILFLTVLQDMTLRPRGVAVAGQMLAHLKFQTEIQEARDRMHPVTQEMGRSKAIEDLENLTRQFNAMLVKLQGTNPGLANKLKGLHEGLAMMDLTMQDIPRQVTQDGDAVFAVNISATGVAWRTLNTRVSKGDLLEVRMGVSRDGKVIEKLVSYGNVVVAQPPDEQRKCRIACYFEYMSPQHREALQGHIVRKQREALVRQAAE
ncbi:MAG: hypothetical protein H7839_12470 [Magnetococcus sp. YQC-5]